MHLMKVIIIEGPQADKQLTIAIIGMEFRGDNSEKFIVIVCR